MGLVADRVQLMGCGCWSSLSVGSFLAGCLEKLRQAGEHPGVLSQYQGPREWGALLCG